MLIDSHAHLNDKRLIDEVEDIVRDMPKDNLEAIINVGYDYESSKVSVELANRFSNVYAAVGIHPHDAKYAAKSHYEFFEKAVKDEKVLAIGEIGLDFYYDHSPRDIQEKVFLEQLDLAHSLKKPAIIHLRDAYRPMYNLLKENIHKLEYGAILHCYSGSAEMLKEFAKLGLYFSFGGAITFKNAKNKPEVIRQTPIDKLLLETDCPYMTPEPYRGKTNYPKYISLVARRVAEILGKDYDDIVRTTNENTKRFFGPKLRK
ncbi:MAG: TatD family hydrolase [Bacillota bacterium]|jgi:TatD DNase family protein|nr:TatD family hydrolase [Bacillota bacterium]